MAEQKKYIVILEPKNSYRASHVTLFSIVTASCRAEAISAAHYLGMAGDERYFKKPSASVLIEDYVYRT